MAISNNVLVAPLNTASVASYIGSTSLDVGTLCSLRGVYINKWARCKPIGTIEQKEDITDAQRIEANFGLMVGLGDEDATIFSNRKSSTLWDYTARPATNFARLTDFIGYNKFAEKPFTTSIEVVRGAPNATKGYLRVFAGLNSAAEFQLSEMGMFDYTGCGWGVLYKVAGGTLQSFGVDVDNSTISYPLSANMSVDIPITTNTAGKNVEAAVVIVTTNKGTFNLPDAWGDVNIDIMTPQEYFHLTYTVDSYLVEGTKNKVYTALNIITDNAMTRSIAWTYEINVLKANGSIDSTITLNGTASANTIGSFNIPIGDDGEVEGSYGVWRDETGGEYGYSGELKIIVNNLVGYAMTTDVDIETR